MAESARSFTSWYIMAVLISLGVALITEDKYIGILLAVALMLWIGGLEQKRKKRASD